MRFRLPTIAGLTSVLALCAGLTGANYGVAQAGFVSPAPWQANGTEPSEDILAYRAALTSGVGAAVADSAQLFPEESWALSIFYQSRSFDMVWMDGGMPSEAATDLTRVLRAAGTHALPVEEYSDAVEKISTIGPHSSLPDRIDADVSLSRAALVYARHASAGRVIPRALADDITIDPETADPSATLEAIVASIHPGATLEKLNPQTKEYAALRLRFAELRLVSEAGEPTKVPSGRVLKPGMTESRIAILRQRLVETGDLASETSEKPLFFDEKLEHAVIAFQIKKGLPADSVVGPMTLNALNHTVGDQLKKIVVNMERRRWMPNDLGKRHVLVNQADFRMKVIDDGEVFHSARVVVGKPRHRSPAFSDEIETVVFNPYWNVPDSITYNEYMPLIQQDPTVMARQGFQAFVSDGQRFVPADLSRVNWRHPDAARLKIKLRQPPGRGNALGRVKFLFPNEHSVYLHDTPSKSLFKRASRAFSHGCIRVQDPLKFAEVLLEREGWSRADVDKAVARGTNQHIRLKNKIPVHLIYWTAFADDSGQIQFRDDVYGRDERLAEALGFDTDALKMAQLIDN